MAPTRSHRRGPVPWDELPEIPSDRKSFRIGEAAKIVGVEVHVLRYWEKTIPQVKPRKAGGNQRRYSPSDIRLLRRIRHLLYERGYTMEGVRRALRSKDEPLDVPQEVTSARRGPAELTDDYVRQLEDENRRLREGLAVVRAELERLRRLVEEA